ncbi:MAG TPA: transcriptional repressor [Candidatus Saccharimonadales bacterium]|nr:transcriptional repressor [Candidatus Saccharimonadales bacterium]
MDKLSSLKKEGHRITKARKAIIDTFNSENMPLSVGELNAKLQKLGVMVNKTTLYREIEFLLSQKMIVEINLGEDKKRYELASNAHHHHLVCLNCKRVEDIDLQNDLLKQESSIAKSKGFKVSSHSLEFFGLCKNCQPI